MPRVLVEHDGVVVVDKPAGLPSTGRTLDDPACVQGWLMGRLRRRKVWAVHQLDTDTTGLNVFVLRKPLVAVWSEHLRVGRKTYVALARGRVGPTRVVVEVPIGRRRRDGRWWPALDPAGGKAARSVVQLREAGAQASLVTVDIETGRSHQVRLHLAHLGHPILGERQHVTPPDTSVPRCLLHAWRLELPTAPEPLRELVAPIPEDLVELASDMGLHPPRS